MQLVAYGSLGGSDGIVGSCFRALGLRGFWVWVFLDFCVLQVPHARMFPARYTSQTSGDDNDDDLCCDCCCYRDCCLLALLLPQLQRRRRPSVQCHRWQPAD